jgi:polyphenol oxidase
VTRKHTEAFASGATNTAAGGAVFVEPSPAPKNARVWFFTRIGGVSEAPFDSLNISTRVGDSRENVEENLSRIREAMGGNPSAWVRQVAGDEVVRVSGSGFAGEADALVSSEEGVSLVVGVADCVPVALVGEESVAMVHSGWRGTLSGISGKTARKMGERSVAAYIGPCIRRCCYEVSEDLAQRFVGEFGKGVVSGRRLSLADAIREDLGRVGVEEIHDLGVCTGCRPDLFFSHRMEKPATGRSLAAIAKTSKAKTSKAGA